MRRRSVVGSQRLAGYAPRVAPAGSREFGDRAGGAALEAGIKAFSQAVIASHRTSYQEAASTPLSRSASPLRSRFQPRRAWRYVSVMSISLVGPGGGGIRARGCGRPCIYEMRVHT